MFPRTRSAGGKEARAVSIQRNEHTLADQCEITGRGYWSGQAVRVTCSPASVGTGIQLCRTDLASLPVCPARTEYANAISFRTNLRRGDASFTMVEHLMAALRGLEIDNCVIEIDGEELPGLDGSSGEWTRSLQNAGLVIQPAAKRELRIESPIRMESDQGWIVATPIDGDDSQYEYQLDYGVNATIRSQTFSMRLTPSNFVRQVATARTFVTLDQAEQLRRSGVASHVTNQDLLVIGPQGPVDNAFRFRNECARHKTLDMIGDLSLVGVDLIGRFVSYRGGHQLNGLMAERLHELVQSQGSSVTTFSRSERRRAA